jgi:hypothetical protein
MLAKNCDLPVVYLKQTMPASKALTNDEDAIRVFQNRVRELEARYDHGKIHWANTWQDIPAIVDKILAGD